MIETVMSTINRLNRYTTLPVLLDLLARKKVVLLDPDRWEDRNDAELISEYKSRKECGSVLAICFSSGEETIHDWKTYADGVSGCCIQFDPDSFLRSFPEEKGFRHQKVEYHRIDERFRIEVDDIPFTKRRPYRCEEEYRIIWHGPAGVRRKEVRVDLDSITRITVSQKMPSRVFATIKDLLGGVQGRHGHRVIHSTLYRNKRWIRKFRDA